MPTEPKEIRDQASRWLEDAPGQLTVLRRLVNGYEHLIEATQAAERELERLRSLNFENEQLRTRIEASEHETGRLRQELGQLRAEVERMTRERDELAATVAQSLDDVLSRLRARSELASGAAG
jgi:septal ring factor EnvC (AmiA/AmiB activator)